MHIYNELNLHRKEACMCRENDNDFIWIFTMQCKLRIFSGWLNGLLVHEAICCTEIQYVYKTVENLLQKPYLMLETMSMHEPRVSHDGYFKLSAVGAGGTSFEIDGSLLNHNLTCMSSDFCWKTMLKFSNTDTDQFMSEMMTAERHSSFLLSLCLTW